MKTLKLTWIFPLIALLMMGAAKAQENRNISEYNLNNGLGLKGYDPVSYFAEGGSQPAKGSSAIAYVHEGVRYLFSSIENREIFKTQPERYEPTYGGWCAWAMANGSAVDIDPTIYTINGNRIHFFIARRAKRNFDRDIPKYEGKADVNWERMSGEKPRL